MILELFFTKNTRNLVKKNDLFAQNFETVKRFSSQLNFDCLYFAKPCIIELGSEKVESYEILQVLDLYLQKWKRGHSN